MMLLLGLACCALLPSVVGSGEGEVTAFKFSGQNYVHRFTKGDLHEYTPKGQPDLTKWTDMVTVSDYSKATDGDGLAGVANSVLENYKSHGAKVVRTDSVPRTEKHEAEHLIVVLFPQPTFIEAALARFLMNGKAGCSVVYSHRVYGSKAGDAMSAWLSKNGPALEKALMAMKPIPVAPKGK